ncbi:histidine triad nucleotide-binding protein [Natronoglycomyces albus]|uniref:Histidine triad nucleotide-binding protein n=1 Tax=Natronoglycomyces albus TaxID=2811108 RepID=A0A895XQC3_9ACTN|nr:histidine triad nucleotide-binding protein [Natronoglycomyces albus]QSB04470.1 histidine triad nucleotide-binding protein [Natronoglycomyces albus]
MSDCIFCKIVGEEIPARVVRSTERVIAFHDIAPAAPTHIQVIPRQHHANLAEVTAADPSLAGEMIAVASEVATGEGLDQTGWRLIANTGRNGGQEIDHAHVHVLGGKPLGPMLGG